MNGDRIRRCIHEDSPEHGLLFDLADGMVVDLPENFTPNGDSPETRSQHIRCIPEGTSGRGLPLLRYVHGRTRFHLHYGTYYIIVEYTTLLWNILYYWGIYYIIVEDTTLLQDILYYCEMCYIIGECSIVLWNILYYYRIHYIIIAYTILL